MQALITGITGQDGSYLAEHLLGLGYKVIGIKRRSSSANDERIKHLYRNESFSVETGDVTDLSYMFDAVRRIQPDELYNLAAQSHVKESFAQPILTTDVVYGGALNCLEAIRMCSKETKFYQASSSEMFGSSYSYKNSYDQYDVIEHYDFLTTPVKKLWISNWCGQDDHKYIEERFQRELADGTVFQQPFQNELTPFLPNSPYAIAKLAAHNLVRLYREAYGIFACSGILFNHESRRRQEMFVTRKISKFVGNLIKTGPHFGKLKLGNLEARRDWGHAADYVRGMHLMLQHGKPDDYVLATGETRSIKDFLEEAFSMDGEFPVGFWEQYVVIDESLKRPMEVPYLRGDASKAKKILGWEPKISFSELVHEMVEHDSKS